MGVGKMSVIQAEHLKKCLKHITLKFLKTRWDASGIKDLRLSKKLILGSDKMLYLSEYKKRGLTKRSLGSMLSQLHCIWSNDFNKTLKKKRSIENLKHIFISQICYVAEAEYAKVCKMLNLDTIILVSFKDDKIFFKESKKNLKIPGVKIKSFFI